MPLTLCVMLWAAPGQEAALADYEDRVLERLDLGQLPLVALGLVLAAWGHLLLREAPWVRAPWTRLDSLFPPIYQSSPGFAGLTLLVMGGMVAVLGAAV